MLNIEQIITGNIQENCYLIYNDTHLLIIDPGADAKKLLNSFKNAKDNL
ncbi:hypothetical protein HNQ48_001858 [Melissococcus plutonius]|nr:hypothetical protein [Melissococcus plutonius]